MSETNPVSINMDLLQSLFPNGWNDKHGDAAKFKSGDAEYRCYQPKSEKDSDTGWHYHLSQDHIRDMAQDDHVRMKVIFDTKTAELQKVEYEYLKGKDKLGDTAIDLISKVATTAIDLTLDVITEGLAIEFTPEMRKVIGKATEAVASGFNKLAGLIVRLSDDGGRINMMAVANHDLNKLLCAVFLAASKTPAKLSPKVRFDEQLFLSNMGHKSWDEKDGHAIKYDLKSAGGDDYRTWRWDASCYPQGMGMYLSTKLDHVRDNKIDDHMVVMLGFDPAGRLFQAQAAVQIEGVKSSDPIVTDVIRQNKEHTLDLAKLVEKAVADKLDKHYDSDNTGRHELPAVLAKNINAMKDCVVGAGQDPSRSASV